jgi:hypothetical protein
MAMIITPTGKNKKHKPINGKTFTIYEISKYLDGLVEPAFIGNNWVFINKNGSLLKMQYNEYASKMMGFDIYGLCLIVPQEELPCQFFLADDEYENDEYENDNYESNESNAEYKETKHQQNESDYMLNDDIEAMDNVLSKIYQKEQEVKKLKIFYEQAYKNLISSNKSYYDLLQNFIVYENENNVFDCPTKESKTQILQNMITFFINIEEYEKCTDLLNLKLFIEENDND